MKKLLAVLLVVAGFALAQEAKVPKFSIGLDMPVFSWVSANDDGAVTSLFGFNFALGVSYRSYFSPLEIEKGSGYWEAGTVVLIDPYVGAGYDYRISEQLYAGAGLDVFPLHPLLYGGYGLFLTFVPNLHIGMYLF